MRSGDQLIQRSTANPPSRTSTGIQKWTSVSTTFVSVFDLSDTLVSRTQSLHPPRELRLHSYTNNLVEAAFGPVRQWFVFPGCRIY